MVKCSIMLHFIMVYTVCTACLKPLQPIHGSISFTGTDVGSTGVQSCDRGFRLSGVTVIACLDDGLWSHPPVKCTRIKCARPVIPMHGTINFTGTKVGDIAEQSCDLGYELAGFKVITCLDDGLWSHPPVTCSLIETKNCRLSNEGCSENADCCSDSCVQQHEGTDPRCEQSSIHYPCFKSWQCEDGLHCGEQYSCCSPFWGVCSDVGDCCEKEHVCRPEEGFIYKRCLKPSLGGVVLLSRHLAIAIVTMHIFRYLTCLI